MRYKINIPAYKTTFKAAEEINILDSALSQNINIPYGCKQGSCGSCKAKVISGRYYHIDNNITGLFHEELKDHCLLCKTIALSDLEIDVQINPQNIRRIPTKIEFIEYRNNIAILKLKLPPKDKIEFFAGQYIRLYFNPNLRRSYSIASSPKNNNEISLHIKNYEGGAASKIVFEEGLRVKQILRIEGPFGGFYVDKEKIKSKLIMACSGVGIAPIHGIIQDLIDNNSNIPVHLYWAIKNIESYYLSSEIQCLIDKYPLLKFKLIIRNPKDINNPPKNIEDLILEDNNMNDVSVYACGPEYMVTNIKTTLIDNGLHHKQYFADPFTASM